ncbi:Hypothetical protein SMAX5B_021960 [Scophthalmus maximus]|uniref:Uncharacterized protein n=1 Tax=Scophthalmus maximus TaxID=52904 RepID=A0A2U9CKH0_SCOMX|nr:Hypothetical protein SMAX5B_021960 [Scophthalmus maximus]
MTQAKSETQRLHEDIPTAGLRRRTVTQREQEGRGLFRLETIVKFRIHIIGSCRITVRFTLHDSLRSHRPVHRQLDWRQWVPHYTTVQR